MPLKADPQGGGTNADGTRNQEYCSYCYVGGRFVSPDMSIDEMRALVVDKLRERGTRGSSPGSSPAGWTGSSAGVRRHESDQAKQLESV